MPTTTTNYSFQKPVVGADEDAWGGYINSNFDSLDSLLSGTTALTSLDITGDISIGGQVTGDLTVDTNTLHVDSTNNKVGIGTISPTQVLDITTAGTTRAFIRNTNLTSSGMYIGEDSTGQQILGTGAYPMRFGTNGSEAMRIDSSGNLLVGKSSANNNAVGVEAKSNGNFSAVADGITPVLIRRKTSDGVLLEFAKDSTTVGSIGVQGGTDTYYAGQSTSWRIRGDVYYPADGSGNYVDNLKDIGNSNYRLDDIYATNGTIQTSDRNEKQDIEALSDAEQRVAVACKGLIRKFRWKDAVAKKGDDARIHFGIIAQDLQDAFAAEGLDAGRYAMFISTTWWETQTEVLAVEAVDEVLDEDGNVIQEAVEAKEAYTRTDTYDTAEEAPEGATERTRLGVRYPELLAFIIAAM